MNCPRKFLAAGLAVCVAGAFSTAPKSFPRDGVSTPQDQDPRARIRTTVSLVVVPVTVEALAGGFSPADEVSLWRFDEVPELVADFIPDNDAPPKPITRSPITASKCAYGSQT